MCTDIDVTHPINIIGWVLGCSSPAVSVEVVHEGTVVRHIPINVRRPDIAAAYPQVPRAVESGFRAAVSVAGETELELLLQAVLEDNSRISLGKISIWRRLLRSDFQPGLQPLMLTSLGRSGSTWLVQLLGQHPQILTYRPFQHEPRVGSYWMQILKTLSEPVSYLQPITGRDKTGEYWWLGSKNSPDVVRPQDPHLQQWLRQDNTETLAAFCLGRIEAFYEQIAMIQNETQSTYYAEKYVPDDSIPAMLWGLCPQGREVLLIRDLRDMVASILAFNAKRGYAAFGRERAASNEEYAYQLRASALRLLQSWEQRSDRAYLLRYEDVIMRPKETLGSVLEYLNLNPTTSIVEDMIRAASEETLDMRKHRTSSDIRSSVGRWRHDLNASLQAVCQEAFGDILEKFGYEE
jgi:hypothetical protein